MPNVFQEDALIIDQKRMAQATYRLRLRSPLIARSAKTGQFVMLQIRKGAEPLLRRPFSFHRIFPEEGVIEVLYKVVGRGTWLLSHCSIGTLLNLVGPLGNGFRLPGETAGSIVLVAGGIGIAPIWELMFQALNLLKEKATERILLFYGARTAAELMPLELFMDLEADVYWSTDDGSLGYCGYVPQLLQEVAEKEKLNPSFLYACGPLAMQYHVAQWAIEHHVPAQLSLESLMACGIGACLGCALPAVHPEDSAADHYVHVCKDGPIFEPGAIQWHKIPAPQTEPPISPCS